MAASFGDINAVPMLPTQQGVRSDLGPSRVVSLFVVPLVAFVVVSIAFAFLWDVMPLPVLVAALVLLIALSKGVPPSSFRGKSLGVGSEGLLPMGMSMWAILSGMLTGIYSFEMHVSQFYAMALGNSYDNVLASMPGAAYADASKIRFADTSTVQVDLSVGYRMNPTYCVAPVMDSGTAQTNTATFWAIGVDCCPARGNFMCGASATRAAGGAGVRARTDGLFVDSNREFRHAIAQAAAIAELTVDADPILLHWVSDPSAEQLSQMLRACGVVFGGAVAFALLSVVSIVVVSSARAQGTGRAMGGRG